MRWYSHSLDRTPCTSMLTVPPIRDLKFSRGSIHLSVARPWHQSRFCSHSSPDSYSPACLLAMLTLQHGAVAACNMLRSTDNLATASVTSALAK
jgi:hypothetical protein